MTVHVTFSNQDGSYIIKYIMEYIFLKYITFMRVCLMNWATQSASQETMDTTQQVSLWLHKGLLEANKN